MPLPREEREKDDDSLGDTTSLLIRLQDRGSMTEINFRFPSIFRQGVSFPCGQVQPSARGALVRDNVVNFVFFFGINHVRRGTREGWTMCFRLAIRR